MIRLLWQVEVVWDPKTIVGNQAIEENQICGNRDTNLSGSSISLQIGGTAVLHVF